MDESGDPGYRIDEIGNVIEGSSKYFTLAGIIVDDAEKDRLDGCIREIISKYFRPDQLDPGFKLHYNPLIQGKSPPYDQLTKMDRIRLADDVFATIRESNCSLLSVTIGLEHYRKKSPRSMDPKAHSMLTMLEMFQKFLATKSSGGFAVDERFNKRERKKMEYVMRNLTGRRYHRPELGNVRGSIRDGDPAKAPILQLADFFAYATQKMHDTGWQKADRWKSIRRKYYNPTDAYDGIGHVII